MRGPKDEVASYSNLKFGSIIFLMCYLNVDTNPKWNVKLLELIQLHLTIPHRTLALREP